MFFSSKNEAKEQSHFVGAAGTEAVTTADGLRHVLTWGREGGTNEEWPSKRRNGLRWEGWAHPA